VALADRIGLPRPQSRFARRLCPETTAYQTIQVVFLLAYDLVGNNFRAMRRQVNPEMTHHGRKKNARRQGRAIFWP
jgi:hypothetical protein